MKHLLAVLALLLLGTTAKADSFTSATLSFTGSDALTGSFTYDNTTNQFTSFGVGTGQWGFSFGHDTFSSPGGPVYLTCIFGPSPCPQEGALFNMLMGGGTFSWAVGFISVGYDGWFNLAGVEVINNSVCCGTPASGTFTVSPLTSLQSVELVSTPEPATLVLLIVGLFALSLRAK